MMQPTPRIEASTRQNAVPGVLSLVWNDEHLVDWAAGYLRIDLAGHVTPSSIIYDYRFDAACASPSGRYVVLYERLGTKGLVLDQGQLIREINRSFYLADVYEYPVTMAALDSGQEVLIHCPEEYNQLEIDDLATGQRLTASASRESSDFFHSRLAVCGRFLLSAGWFWHPLEYVYVYDWHAALGDPRLLDEARELTPIAVEMAAAAFLDEQHLIVATTAESFAGEKHKELLNMQAPNSLGIWDLHAWQLLRQVPVDEPIGTIMPLGTSLVVSFYEHPKVIDITTGQVIWRMPELKTGLQQGSIIPHIPTPPPLALDPARQRFAVATDEGVTVVQLRYYLD